MITQAYLEKILKKEWLDKLTPYLEDIKAITDKHPIHIGGNFNNRDKHFKKGRLTHVAKTVIKTCPEIFKSKRLDILNVGSAYCEHSVIFRHFEHQVINIDGSQQVEEPYWFIEDYKKVNEILGFDWREVNLPGDILEGCFDLIFCSEMLTLKCVFNKIHIISNLLANLNENGRLVIVNHKGCTLKNPIQIYDHVV